MFCGLSTRQQQAWIKLLNFSQGKYTPVKFNAHLFHLRAKDGELEIATDCTSKRAHKHLTSLFLSSFKKGFTHVLIRKTSLRERQLLLFYDYSFKVEKDA